MGYYRKRGGLGEFMKCCVLSLLCLGAAISSPILAFFFGAATNNLVLWGILMIGSLIAAGLLLIASRYYGIKHIEASHGG